MTNKECREMRKILAVLGAESVGCGGRIFNLPEGDPRIAVEQAKADTLTMCVALLENKLMELTDNKLYSWDEQEEVA